MSFYLTYHDFLTLYKLAKVRNQSTANYFSFEAFQGGMLTRYLMSKGVHLSGSRLLDIGCGFGGYIQAFEDEGASVVGLDLTPLDMPGRQIILGDALTTPTAEATFDIVVCASLIEHVAEPLELLKEIWRILKPGGIFYLSYPPYYSPRGGHQFSPFHLLGQSTALAIAKRRGLYRREKWLQERFPTDPESFESAFGSWGLYVLTIAKTRRLLKQLPFETLDCSTRWLPLNFANIPVLGELLTWHVQFLLRKQ